MMISRSTARAAFFLTCTALGALAGCSKGRDAATTSTVGGERPPRSKELPPRPMPVLHKTDELVTTPAVRDAVNLLAKETRIESSHVGAGGVESATYTLFDKAWNAATPAEREKLIEHESPVVRGYFAQRFGREADVMPIALAPLLDDPTPVGSLQGCNAADSTIQRVVLDALCWSNAKGAGDVLIETATSEGALAGEALSCAAPKAPAAASAIALANITRGAPSKLLEGSFRVLAVSPHPSACGPARDAALDGTPEVARAAISALALCADDASVSVLQSLRSSENKSVSRGANLSLVMNPKTPSELRRSIADDKSTLDSVGTRLGAILKSPTGSLVVIPVVEEILALGPSSMPSAFSSIAESPEATTLMRALAAKEAAPTDAHGWTIHTAAVGYLARVKDSASLPLFRAALDAQNVPEIRFALAAVRDLRDGGSRAAVEKLTHHEQKDVATLASDVLAKL